MPVTAVGRVIESVRPGRVVNQISPRYLVEIAVDDAQINGVYYDAFDRIFGVRRLYYCDQQGVIGED